MIDVQRDRIDYLYQQNQAKALRAAVPNPLGLLSAVQSFDLKKLIISGIYMTVDSITSYNEYKSEAEEKYLKDGWELDDKEAAIVADLRSEAFGYMVEIVNDHNIPGELALNENAVKELVAWKDNTNVAARIQFLEDNYETYKQYGDYWLIRAQAYYEHNDYEKCLNDIDTYEAIQGKIFKKDHRLAESMPYAIVAAQETIKNKSLLEEKLVHYVEQIIANTNNDDWALRYFATQTYVQLYRDYKNKEYLEKAYKTCRSNVNYLVNNQSASSQRKLNEVYLADLQKRDTKNGTSEEKKRNKEYNKLIEAERKVALAPISEPLLLNCDLLFALARELKIPKSEQNNIDSILHENNAYLFLSKPIDDMYWFNKKNSSGDIQIDYDCDTIVLPSTYLTESYEIKVTITTGESSKEYNNWTVEKVDRVDKSDPYSFMATLKCDDLKKSNYSKGSIITIEILPTTEIEMEPLKFVFKVTDIKSYVVYKKVVFEKVS